MAYNNKFNYHSVGMPIEIHRMSSSLCDLAEVIATSCEIARLWANGEEVITELHDGPNG